MDEQTSEEFKAKVEEINRLLAELAAMTRYGGLYIEDMDHNNGIYALSSIEETEGNVRIQAHMWTQNALTEKTGYFRSRW